MRKKKNTWGPEWIKLWQISQIRVLLAFISTLVYTEGKEEIEIKIKQTNSQGKRKFDTNPTATKSGLKY